MMIDETCAMDGAPPEQTITSKYEVLVSAHYLSKEKNSYWAETPHALNRAAKFIVLHCAAARWRKWSNDGLGCALNFSCVEVVLFPSAGVPLG